MQTWWIGPTIGAIFGTAGIIRGRRADRRLVRIENALTKSAAAQPERISQNPEIDLGSNFTDSLAARKVLGEAIARLPEREKLIITLRYYEELSSPEIAEILGISTTTASRLEARALNRLREHFQDPE